MNPVDEVDDLLTRAGARWRADQDPAPEPDLEYMMSGGRKQRRWVPALAAAGVAAVAAGVIAVLPGAEPPAPQAFAASNKSPYDELLVHDGDQVTATGRVIVEPGADPVLCPQLPQPLSQSAHCPAQYAVKLKNLGNPKARVLSVTGIWSGRTIDVRTQAVPGPTDEPSVPPDNVPCPPPAGGWSTRPNVIDNVAVSEFLATHENQAADPELLYPMGRAPGAPEVYTIGVAHGDPVVFRQSLEQLYHGNLCVHQVKFSKAELTRMANAVAALIPKGLGVYAAAQASDKVSVSALAYDEALKNALTPVGPDNVNLVVSIRPVR